MEFSAKKAFARGAEIRRIAVLGSCPIKDTLRFITKGSYLVLEVYDEAENRLHVQKALMAKLIGGN